MQALAIRTFLHTVTTCVVHRVVHTLRRLLFVRRQGRVTCRKHCQGEHCVQRRSAS